MRFIKWLAVLAPAAAGLALDILIARGIPNIPILYLRADLGIFLLLTGMVLSLLCVGVTLFYDWAERRLQVQAHVLHDEANDERRRFLRRLDHELKNPLTAIRAGLANISEGTSAPARQDALTSVETQALRLSRLAADLRKLAELETRPVERVPVDMAAMLQEAFTLAEDSPEASERRLNLTLPRAPWPLPKISGDQDLLFLAVHNLLDNAIKFTRPGDTIEVRAIEDGSNLVVEIADTGPGIGEDDIPHVWEELYRGQGARGVPGSGLGLALVRAIAERHNGQVSLRSRAGQGTVFTLKLPVG
jgi:two-component system OmpR family sensor kinase